MKKVMSIFLFVLLSTASSHQSYAMMGDVPDDMALLFESLHFVEDGCKQCVNFLKNSISRFTPSTSSKKAALVITFTMGAAGLLALTNRGVTLADGSDNMKEIIQGNECLLAQMQNWCSTLLSLDSIDSPECADLIAMIAAQESGLFNDCVNQSPSFIERFSGFSYSLPWDKVITCASFMGYRVLEQCRLDNPFSESCVGLAYRVVDALQDPQLKEQCLRLLCYK